jgi:hypothetical protein
MEVILIVLGFAAVGLAAQRWGVDSRPVIGDSHTDRGQRWFPRTGSGV